MVGVIIFGNFEKEVKFSEEDLEVLRAFEKELVLGYQSAQVLERVKSLEVVDSLHFSHGPNRSACSGSGKPGSTTCFLGQVDEFLGSRDEGIRRYLFTNGHLFPKKFSGQVPGLSLDGLSQVVDDMVGFDPAFSGGAG